MTIVEQTKSALIHKSHIINRVNLKKVQEHCSNASYLKEKDVWKMHWTENLVYMVILKNTAAMESENNQYLPIHHNHAVEP